MEIYLALVVLLFILAVSDLVVGVGNDAVNFLNSAFGSKVAPRHIILIVSSVGIIAGTIFSSGMMEVARKGIFNPQHFYFPELMMIFLAVMLTDVILLDFFNTLGLPTSTTVSIVFELLGASFAISIVKITNASQDLSMLVNYINTSKAITIISGILLSIVVAFSVGAIVQFITRLVFTFDYNKKMNRYGGIFGGIAMTSITFFILIKGVKGAAFMHEDTKAWIMHNADLLILFSVIFWSVIFQILHWIKVNILKVIVLIGTFSLALAFAANDLVNFIGVPIAGLNSFQLVQGSTNPETQLMQSLLGKVEANPWLLILAGFIMIFTIYFNKKARGVIQTSVDLGRQTEGDERFQSSLIARNIVRANMTLADGVRKVIPGFVLNWISKRFEGANRTITDEHGERISFDLIRASVNLFIASILISIATSWKLPLSTTYVTFMVAMGTSFSDKAWGRDSAVYRINGVFTVISGWFFTAFIAFTVAGIFALIIYYGGTVAIILISLLALFLVYRTHKIHRKAQEEVLPEDELITEDEGKSISISMGKIYRRYVKFFNNITGALNQTFDAFIAYDRTALKEQRYSLKKIKKSANKIINDMLFIVKSLPEGEIKKARRFGKLMGATQEISFISRNFIENLYDHVNNNHRPLLSEQNEKVREIKNELANLLEMTIAYFENNESFENITAKTEALNETIQKFDAEQMALIRKQNPDFSTRGNLLYIDILSFADNLSSQIYHLISVITKNVKAFGLDLNSEEEKEQF